MQFQEHGVYIQPNKSKIHLSGLDTSSLVSVSSVKSDGFLLTSSFIRDFPIWSHSYCIGCGYIEANIEITTGTDVYETRPTNKAVRYLVRAMD